MNTLLFLLGLVSSPQLCDQMFSWWVADLSRSPVAQVYEQPTLSELNTAKEIYLEAFAAPQSSGVLEKAGNAGYDIVDTTFCGQRHFAVVGRTKRTQPWGMLVFNQSATQNFVAAPHQFHDLNTGNIASMSYINSSASGLWLNTVGRHSGEGNARNSADTTKLKNSTYHQFFIHLATKMDKVKLIEIHGFAAKKRRTVAAKSIDIIISNGNQTVPSSQIKLQHCWRKHEIRSLIYPVQTQELGATKNKLAQRFSNIPTAEFLHVEMSDRFRSALLTQKNNWFATLSCLFDASPVPLS